CRRSKAVVGNTTEKLRKNLICAQIPQSAATFSEFLRVELNDNIAMAIRCRLHGRPKKRGSVHEQAHVRSLAPLLPCRDGRHCSGGDGAWWSARRGRVQFGDCNFYGRELYRRLDEVCVRSFHQGNGYHCSRCAHSAGSYENKGDAAHGQCRMGHF